MFCSTINNTNKAYARLYRATLHNIAHDVRSHVLGLSYDECTDSTGRCWGEKVQFGPACQASTDRRTFCLACLSLSDQQAQPAREIGQGGQRICTMGIPQVVGAPPTAVLTMDGGYPIPVEHAGHGTAPNQERVYRTTGHAPKTHVALEKRWAGKKQRARRTRLTML